MNNRSGDYNLEARTLEFSKRLIDLCKQIKLNFINKNIIDQLLRSGFSIGANYHEANGAVSKSDFKNKISICKKESKETGYWLELLLYEQKDNNTSATLIQKLIKENQEFILIFSKIFQSSKSEKRKNN